ncbi:glycosyltransferase [Loktanella sp. D2R18]|uniref:glycosyltransferase family 2 protein n=1 Tax=Rhodobacterales TaxID=204455 RepID=UPI000DE9E6FB|nr:MULTISPECIES: glycosyltransferase family 2 protein [Rhodobacterales]MDO6588964.1 glycosyltransferase family 2 protein [Yoonia sp. 1_MG-2023]RBW41819.1 glycosyltransferase [Loktanella sp. D2R18]
MKISVVTAVMTGAQTLSRMLDSLAQQTYPDIEHLVQDGGSTDGTLDILWAKRRITPKVVSAPDGGIYEAINAGIARVTGDVVGVLHADDQLAGPNVLAAVAKALADPAIDGVYGDLQYVAADGSGRVVRHWTAGPYCNTRLKWGWMPPHPTLYLRRQVFENMGAYDARFRISGDYEAMLRYLSADVRLAYLPQVMVQMQVGGVSNGSLKLLIRKSREDYRAIRRHRIGGAGTLVAKNLSKLPQFLRHP